MPEEKEYADKLRKVEKVNQLRMQRETDSSQGKRRSPNSGHSLPPPMSRKVYSWPNTFIEGSSSSRGSVRTPTSASARALLERDDPYQITKRNLENVDLSYKDPFGPAPSRPKTGSRLRNENEDMFDDVDILDDDLLPDGE